MLKKAMLGLMALCFAVVLGSPAKANAQVAFGATLVPAHTRVFVGGYAAPGYYNGYDYDDDDYAAPYYTYPSYGYADPAYDYPYASNNGYYPYYGGHEYWEHRRHEYQEHREHEWREHHHHDRDDWRR